MHLHRKAKHQTCGVWKSILASRLNVTQGIAPVNGFSDREFLDTFASIVISAAVRLDINALPNSRAIQILNVIARDAAILHNTRQSQSPSCHTTNTHRGVPNRSLGYRISEFRRGHKTSGVAF